MSKTTKKTTTDPLGDDSALDAFGLDSSAVAAAFTPRARRTDPTPEPPQTEPSKPTSQPERVPAAPGPAAAHSTPAAGTVSVPQLGETGSDIVQCSIVVERQVRQRVVHYQNQKKAQTGVEPSNALVVRRAFVHAQRQDLWTQLHQYVRTLQAPISDEDLDIDLDNLFCDVPERRPERGVSARHTTQQSFRPSRQELAVYDAFADAHEFANRSDFLNAALDAFLPALPARRKSL
ncbi:hypothetical protein ACOKM5_43740 [Streptomyces sp. BH097]|uniref:hypothetical protein n=1 Tax=unclassified Streptomyces TaxID=2593676 RepID=UPI003BB53941